MSKNIENIPSTFAQSKTLYLRLLTYVKPYWKVFTIAIIAMVVLAATQPAMPALLKPLLDGSFVDKDPEMISLVPILLILLAAIQGTSTYISTVALAWVSNKVVMDIRNEMFLRLLSLPSSYYDNQVSGKLMSKITYDVSQVATAATHVLVVLVRDTLAVIGLLGWMLWINWKLTMTTLIILPLIALVVWIISQRLRNLSRAQQNAMGDMTHSLEETISANKVVKVFRGEQYESQRFASIANWLRRYQMKFISTSSANAPVVQLITASALAFIIYIASLQSLEGQLTVGEFISFITAMAMLFSPIKRLTGLNEHIQRGLAAAESIFALIDQPPEKNEGKKSIEQVQGKLHFDNVSLDYGLSKNLALKQLTLTINPGETVALVGASGSGKTTLVNLLPRFYQPTEGRILLDGINIQDLSLAALRENIALVSQEVVLFNGTVAENIAYGGMNKASEADIVAAAEAAHAMEFIKTMPQGLQTKIGEKGVRLSGGQRQRLAIARALLKNAKILIMDEATSALDTQAEQHVKAAVEVLRQGRTSIVIAHRLSTIENADRIIVLEAGQILETGTHTELLATSGKYAQLYRAQFSEST
ncbi:MAG: lipid A export permease/ATP-binding protein MsbA [Gammaproteobacteria bacterium]|nr:lipid A export permease/ATP-binding protein MsbA [Gammaproteobacteria bacterium]